MKNQIVQIHVNEHGFSDFNLYLAKLVSIENQIIQPNQQEVLKFGVNPYYNVK